MAHEFYYDWHVDLKSTPEALWPFAADTNRFNHDTGLPPVEHIQDAPDLRPGTRRLRFYIYGVKIEWDEEPFEWIFPHRFGVVRHYRSGPVAEMRVQAEMVRGAEGTHLRYQTWARPANLLGYPGIPIQIGVFSRQQFTQTFQLYDRIIQRGGSHYDIPGHARLAPGAQGRLKTARQSIVRRESDNEIVNHMQNLIEHADDLALQRLRPYQLADLWHIRRRNVLEAFLRATRAGMFDLRWELLCPSCRGAGETHPSLSEVHNHAHCNFCNIDYSVNFDRQVEAVFRPNAAVRQIPERFLFCIAGPQVAPHKPLNETLAAGQELAVETMLEEGRFSITSSGLRSELPAVATPTGPAAATIAVDEAGWPEGEMQLGLHPRLRLVNGTRFPQKFVIERAAWRDDAATAADVTSLQVFRDLFSREALRTGEDIEISSTTLMFTDLRDSTRLYRQIGDAPAFGRVRQHFAIIEGAIAAEGGAVVKTMGDSVMAVFRHPVAAMRAIRAAHIAITALEGAPPLHLKAGIHSGPCIAVTLNERLDYFGSTVNIAARLPALAAGGEVIFSDEIINDLEVAGWLKDSNIWPAGFQSAIKGFDHPFNLWRTKMQ